MKGKIKRMIANKILNVMTKIGPIIKDKTNSLFAWSILST